MFSSKQLRIVTKPTEIQVNIQDNTLCDHDCHWFEPKSRDDRKPRPVCLRFKMMLDYHSNWSHAGFKRCDECLNSEVVKDG